MQSNKTVTKKQQLAMLILGMTATLTQGARLQNVLAQKNK
jgi:hypothetical protein